MIEYKNFQDAYFGTIEKLKNEGKQNIVRGKGMLEIIPYHFRILNPRDRMLNIESRNEKIGKYIFGELLWYLSGRNDVEFISKYSSMWAKLSDDGKTNNSAYGQYIFKENLQQNGSYWTQWDFVKQQLIKDQSTRQAIIHLKPIQCYETKDVVCTICLQFNIQNDKLNMITVMRSNDILKGMTYDIFMFTFLQELMASELGLQVGTYDHFVMNMHLYIDDIETIETMIETRGDDPEIMPVIWSSFRERDLPLLLKIHNDEQVEYDKLSLLAKYLVRIGGKYDKIC